MLQSAYVKYLSKGCRLEGKFNFIYILSAFVSHILVRGADRSSHQTLATLVGWTVLLLCPWTVLLLCP